MGLHGQGGIGKTVLAAALARDEVLLHHFPDGVYWVTVGEHTDLVAAQIDLLDRVGVPAPDLRGASDGRARLRAVLEERRSLIVADDIWTVTAADAFDVAGPAGRVLYTTRDPGVLHSVGAEVRSIDVLTHEAGRELLSRLAEVPVSELPADAERVLLASGRVPLALALVAAAVGRGGRSWQQVADALEHARPTFADHPYANSFKAIQVAVGVLNPELRSAYESLVVYPEDTRIPIGAVERWWEHRHGIAPELTHALLEQLSGAELLALEHDAISFHDLQREFLLLHTDSVRLLHHDLLKVYRALLRSPDRPWRELPRNEPYVWERLVEHLIAAGDVAGARQVAADMGYLALRSFRDGPHAAEADVRRVAVVDPAAPGIEWSRRLLAQSGHLLTGHECIEDLAATLALQAPTAPASVDGVGLEALLPVRTIEPVWGLPNASDALKRVLEGHGAGVRGIAFSPDGLTVATGGDDGTVRLWDVGTGSPIRVLDGHGSGVVAFSPDGRTLATGGDGGTVRLWDPSTGLQTGILEGLGSGILEGMDIGVKAVAFSPDGQTIASACYKTVRLWVSATGAWRTVFGGHDFVVNAVAFSPDGRSLAIAATDGTVRLWDLSVSAETSVLTGHGEYQAWDVAFSPDGRTLASSGLDRAVRLWDPSTGAQISVLRGHATAAAVTFSPDGRTLASAGTDGTVRLWDRATATQSGLLAGHSGGAWAVAFSPDGRTLASAGYDRVARLWDPAADTETSIFDSHAYGVRAVAFSPDGRTIASIGQDQWVRLWDPATGTQTHLLEDQTFGLNAVAFSADGRTLASAGARTVRLWNPAAGTHTRDLDSNGWVQTVAFSPDGRTIAHAGADGTVQLWDFVAGIQKMVLECHSDWVYGVAFSPDGRILASGSSGTVRLWNPTTGTHISDLDRTGRVQSVAFSPDGSTLAIATAEGTVQLWDPTTSTQTSVLEGHTDQVNGVAFSRDGRTLASAGDDGTVRLWDPLAATLTLSVRIGDRVAALALDARAIAVGVDRSVACLRIVDTRSGRGSRHGSSVAAPTLSRPGRNDPCWCGSGRKFKKCHGG